MTRILTVLTFVLLCSGCKKAIDKKEEDIVVKAMTNGQWKITNYINNGADISSDYSAYTFQFYSNKTVDAIHNGTVEKTGSWDGNADERTITSSFPNAGSPLLLVNGTWHVDDNSWTFVQASQTAGANSKSMRLDKL